MSWSEAEARSIVRTEVATVLAVEPHRVDDAAPLVEHGLDSLQAMDVVLAVEERFRIEIDETEMADIGTVDDIVALVRTKLGPGRAS